MSKKKQKDPQMDIRPQVSHDDFEAFRSSSHVV